MQLPVLPVKESAKLPENCLGFPKGRKKSASGRENVKSTMESAKAFMMLGAGVALISAGFFLLSQGAKAVADSGPLAVAVLVGMVAAIAGLLIVAKMVAPTLSSGAAGFVAFGAAVVLAAAGIAVLTMSAISLANAGPLAIEDDVWPDRSNWWIDGRSGCSSSCPYGRSCWFDRVRVAAALVGAAVLLASAGLAIVASVLGILADMAYGICSYRGVRRCNDGIWNWCRW